MCGGGKPFVVVELLAVGVAYIVGVGVDVVGLHGFERF